MTCQIELRIEDDSKVASRISGSKGNILKENGRICDFGSLLCSSNEKILCFRGIDYKAVSTKPRVDLVEDRC